MKGKASVCIDYFHYAEVCGCVYDVHIAVAIMVAMELVVNVAVGPLFDVLIQMGFIGHVFDGLVSLVCSCDCVDVVVQMRLLEVLDVLLDVLDLSAADEVIILRCCFISR